jgi:hypothetical protein
MSLGIGDVVGPPYLGSFLRSCRGMVEGTLTGGIMQMGCQLDAMAIVLLLVILHT